MQGFRTIAVGLALAIFPSALSYLGGVQWTQYVSANVAMVLTGLITIGMRCITTTPVGTAPTQTTTPTASK